MSRSESDGFHFDFWKFTKRINTEVREKKKRYSRFFIDLGSYVM